MSVRVVPYDPNWPSAFADEAVRLADAMGEVAEAVHHIGSTSIPGIFAKPIIDILVEASDLALVDQLQEAMELIGYEALGEFGIPGRRYFRRTAPDGTRTHHLHVFERGSDGAVRHLVFRDYLIAHPEFAHRYSDLKRELAKAHPDDMELYMDGKDEFIKAKQRAALEWSPKRLID